MPVLIMGTVGPDLRDGTEDPDEMYGLAGDDTLSGGGGRDVIYGADGQDELNGEAGNDVLVGGYLGDVLNGGDGNDRLIGGSGFNTLIGGDGIDTADYSMAEEAVRVTLRQGLAPMNGFGGRDTLTDIELIVGSAFDDTLVGGEGDDKLVGGEGNDSLSGWDGVDTLIGGAGDDTLLGEFGLDRLRGGAGNNVQDGGRGPWDDIADYSDAPGGVTAHVSLGASENGWGGTDTLAWIGRIIDSDHNDDITIVGGDRIAWGRGGNDVLTGVSRSRRYGGEGDDELNVVVGPLTGHLAKRYGEDGADTLQGGRHTDYLYGGECDDSLNGGNGRDYITGVGNDTMTGALGTDFFRFAPGWGDDVITDWEDGRDTLDFRKSGMSFVELSISQAGSDHPDRARCRGARRCRRNPSRAASAWRTSR